MRARASRARLLLVPAFILAAVGAMSITASAQQPPQLLEPDSVIPLSPEPCKYEGNDPYEKRIYQLEGWKGPDYERYPGACERLRFAYGPILVKPGQNDVLIDPAMIQAPHRNGYMTRFKPDLVLANGRVPPVEEVHLHHGLWYSIPTYGGTLPFLASGEEKTIGSVPKGYGMPIKATDVWGLEYMVHSAIPKTMLAYMTYEVDFIPEAKAERLGIKPVYSFWLDVRPELAYPVFNVQSKYGGSDGRCTWPNERCADFDPWGNEIVGQGKPGRGVGTDLRFPDRGEPWGRVRHFTGGTLIGVAGHLHPGGLTDNIELVRNGRSRRIFTSEAVYWNHRHHRRPGGPPTSWDFSMTGTALPYWAIHVKPGDRLRISATYDTTHQASYEDMGIAIAGLVPNDPNGIPQAPGLNPFRAPRDRSSECNSLDERLTAPISAFRDVGLRADRPALCVKGMVTHGHQAANGNYGGPSGEWNARPGGRTSQVNIANFQYLPGDLSMAAVNGVPTVKLGTSLRFTNLEGAAIYHSITTCRFPCLGVTGAAFPIANGRTSAGRRVDLDSGSLGLGLPGFSPAKETLDWEVPVNRQAGFAPGETVTYFCRIHPFMRGAFQVVK